MASHDPIPLTSPDAQHSNEYVLYVLPLQHSRFPLFEL